ncbi:MAG: sugar nucleotide-binding protein [Candidatus Levybacteria bacterium]|nr:sugar nucleotide-binding protein [Candidatus Levybacteria bacterium]
MDPKKQIIGIGLSGLIGTRIQELLSSTFDFFPMSTEQGLDITKKDSLDVVADHSSETVLLLAAKADVDGCEKDKEQGETGAAWMINVKGVENVIEACQKKNKHLIYVSTDFVFNGEDTPEGGYTEESTPEPINWYGKTKYEAEKRVQASGLSHAIVRPAYPYRKEFEIKKDFYRAIRDRLASGLEVRAVTDHYFNPTLIDDFAYGLEAMFSSSENGIFHLVGSSTVSPFEAAQMIANKFDLDASLVKPTTRAEYFEGKAQRPFKLAMNNDKITKLGVSMHSFEEGLDIIRKQ